jgi:hypothetical protein
MRHGGALRFLAGLALVGFVAALLMGAYSTGYAAGTASNSAGFAPWSGAFGGLFVSSFVMIFVLVVVLNIMRLVLPAHVGPWARFAREDGDEPSGPWHPGWHRDAWRSSARTAFADWHRQAHADGEKPAGPTVV